MDTKARTWSWKQTLVLVVGIICLAAIGCESMMDELMPCIVDSRSMEYIGEEPVRKITTLAKAKEMRKDIGIQYRDSLLELRRKIENEENAHEDALLIDARIEQSENLKNVVVGSAGNPMSLMGILAGTSLGGLVGVKMKRKGDSSPEEVKTKVAAAVKKELVKNGNAK